MSRYDAAISAEKAGSDTEPPTWKCRKCKAKKAGTASDNESAYETESVADFSESSDSDNNVDITNTEVFLVNDLELKPSY